MFEKSNILLLETILLIISLCNAFLIFKNAKIELYFIIL